VVVSSPSRFAAAVAAHPFPAYELDATALERASRSLADTGLLIVGEQHGIRETPSVLYSLASALGTRAVAFEWSHEEMDPAVGIFLRDGSFDFERLWTLPATSEFFCGDGRITAGHFALLQRLHAEGRLDQAIAFDRLDPAPPRDWAEHIRIREPEMAARLLSEWKRDLPLLVLTGAFHAQLEAAEGEPMAAHLARELPGLAPAMLDYESGFGWSRGKLYDASGPMPDAPISLRVGRATPAVIPGRQTAWRTQTLGSTYKPRPFLKCTGTSAPGTT
jgi:hypothetical protein